MVEITECSDCLKVFNSEREEIKDERKFSESRNWMDGYCLSEMRTPRECSGAAALGTK